MKFHVSLLTHTQDSILMISRMLFKLFLYFYFLHMNTFHGWSPRQCGADSDGKKVYNLPN